MEERTGRFPGSRGRFSRLSPILVALSLQGQACAASAQQDGLGNFPEVNWPLFIAGSSFVITGLILFFIQRERYKAKEKVILNMLQNYHTALYKGRDHLAAREAHGRNVNYKKMLRHIDPRSRAWAVEVLDLEMKKQRLNAYEAGKILAPYLRDPNNRVRGNAVRALYRYDPVQAKKFIHSMLEDGMELMQLTGVWLCGEIADHETINWLMKLTGHSSPPVRYRLEKTFEKLLRSGSPSLKAKHKEINQVMRVLYQDHISHLRRQISSTQKEILEIKRLFANLKKTAGSARLKG